MPMPSSPAATATPCRLRPLPSHWPSPPASVPPTSSAITATPPACHQSHQPLATTRHHRSSSPAPPLSLAISSTSEDAPPPLAVASLAASRSWLRCRPAAAEHHGHHISSPGLCRSQPPSSSAIAAPPLSLPFRRRATYHLFPLYHTSSPSSMHYRPQALPHFDQPSPLSHCRTTPSLSHCSPFSTTVFFPISSTHHCHLLLVPIPPPCLFPKSTTASLTAQPSLFTTSPHQSAACFLSVQPSFHNAASSMS